jgi:hypothetical protein
VIITYYVDKSFSIELKTPPAAFLVKEAAGLKPQGKRNRTKGSMKPGREVAGSITVAQVKQDRRDEDEGPQRQLDRSGDEHHPWLCQVLRHRSEGLSTMAKIAKRVKKAQEAFAGKANLSVEDAVKLVKGRLRPSSTKPWKSR